MHFDLNSNLTSIITLIGILAANIVLVINAWRGTNRAVEVKQKLEEIHTSTNGNLSELKKQIQLLEQKSTIDSQTVESLKNIINNQVLQNKDVKKK